MWGVGCEVWGVGWGFEARVVKPGIWSLGCGVWGLGLSFGVWGSGVGD